MEGWQKWGLFSNPELNLELHHRVVPLNGEDVRALRKVGFKFKPLLPPTLSFALLPGSWSECLPVEGIEARWWQTADIEPKNTQDEDAKTIFVETSSITPHHGNSEYAVVYLSSDELSIFHQSIRKSEVTRNAIMISDFS